MNIFSIFYIEYVNEVICMTKSRIKKYAINVLIGIALCVPLVFLIIYLKTQGKTLKLRPKFQIIDATKPTDTELRNMQDAVQSMEQVVKNIK